MSMKIAIKTTALTFCITWGLAGIILIANQFGYLKFGTPLNTALFLIGVCAPTIAAFVILPKNNVITTKGLLKATFATKQPFAYAAIYRISKSVWLCVFIHALNNALYSSFIMRVAIFGTAVIPATITAVVLIIVSILIVTIAENHKKR